MSNDYKHIHVVLVAANALTPEQLQRKREGQNGLEPLNEESIERVLDAWREKLRREILNALIQSVASSDVTIANRVGRDSIAINCYAAIEVQTMTALEFLKRAADGKHRIVSSGDLHVMQISEAQANKLFFVDDQTGLGWALVPWELTTAKDRHREAGFFTRGGSGWNTQLHNEACDSEIAEQRKRLASRAALTECAAERDGDCNHDACPQLKDRQPHCPLDNAEPSA